jgi:hypothetical protein
MLVDRRTFITSIGAGLIVSGCVTTREAGGTGRLISLESLVRHIKHDVGTYMARHPVRAGPAPAADPDPARPCGGQAEFTIQKVKLTVTATSEQSAGVTGGLSVPIGLLTAGATGGGSRARSDTMTISLTIWPVADQEPLTAAPPASPDFEGTPIADALERLHRDLVATADTRPCFDFGKEGDTKDNFVRWGFTVTEKANAGGKLSLLIFSIGAEASTSRVYANTVEATFAGRGVFFTA